MSDEKRSTIDQFKNPAGSFTGLNLVYPEYEVITPQTLQSFTVRTLTVAEEEVLKSSLVTQRKIPEHINNVLWKVIVKKPDHIKTYEDFVNKLTIKDREALVYGIYHITYKDIHDLEIKCSECSKTNKVTFSLDKCFTCNMYPGQPNEILTKIIPVQLKTNSKITFFVKQPLIIDETKLLANPLFSSEKNLELGSMLMAIDRIEIKADDGNLVIKEREELFRTYKTLPANDRKLITEAYANNFNIYEIKLEFLSNCNFCNSEMKGEVPLVQELFRALH